MLNCKQISIQSCYIALSDVYVLQQQYYHVRMVCLPQKFRCLADFYISIYIYAYLNVFLTKSRYHVDVSAQFISWWAITFFQLTLFSDTQRRQIRFILIDFVNKNRYR